MAEKKSVGHAYNVDFLNVVFAASSIFLFLSVIWMVWDDFDRDWKNTQRRFAQLEYQVTQAQRQQALQSVDKSKIAQLEAEKKRYADAKRKEAKEAGIEGEGLESYVKSSLESYLALEPDEVLVRIKDPNKRIQEVSYVDAAGETKHVSMREDEGYTRLSTWGDKPQADWKLRVSMKTSKNLVRQPFALADVPLP